MRQEYATILVMGILLGTTALYVWALATYLP